MNSYDNIILGTPIWAGTYAAPFNTFIDPLLKETKENIQKSIKWIKSLNI